MGGIGFGGLLTIVFIVLKLTKVIAWSWLWVTCPLWILPAMDSYRTCRSMACFLRYNGDDSKYFKEEVALD